MTDQDAPGTPDSSIGKDQSDGSNIQEGTVTRLPGASDGQGSAPPSTGSTGILAQLQQLISQVASAPVTRQSAAKAADLAAMAAEKAGPAARSLAERTEVVAHSVADRATTFASSMRSDQPGGAATSGRSSAEDGAS